MSEHLVFLLHAPLAAMGGVAVGERRAGFDRPAKSAILGLIAAALGLDRSNEAAHRALAEGYGLGLGGVAPGRLLMDYHTAQAPPQRRNRRFATRREELARKNGLGTILSVREYRTDPAYLVALWARATPHWALGQLAEALRRPHFTLYFGRKSCPLGLSLDPRVVEADDPRSALQVYLKARTSDQVSVLRGLRLEGAPLMLALDLDGAGDPANVMRIEHRRDALESRGRWQFGLRSEAIQGRRE
jgi:CRISPR system Cascade subunit CasD